MAADRPPRPEGGHTERSSGSGPLEVDVATLGQVQSPAGRYGRQEAGSRKESDPPSVRLFSPADIQSDSLLTQATRRSPQPLTGSLIGPEDVVYITVHNSRAESGDEAEPLAESSPEPGPGSTGGLFTGGYTGRLSRLVRLEEQAFAASTLQAFAERFAEVVAAAHGLGLAFQCAKWAYGVVKWLNVIDGDGGIGLQIPFPMGPGVFSPAVHLGRSLDPRLTLSVAPTGVSGVGGLIIGRLETDPEVIPAHEREAGPKRYGPVEAIPWHSPDSHPKPISLPPDVAAAGPLIEDVQPPDDVVLMMLRKKRRFRAAGVDLVIWYDPSTGLVVWQELCGADGPCRWSIVEDLSEPQ